MNRRTWTVESPKGVLKVEDPDGFIWERADEQSLWFSKGYCEASGITLPGMTWGELLEWSFTLTEVVE